MSNELSASNLFLAEKAIMILLKINLFTNYHLLDNCE